MSGFWVRIESEKKGWGDNWMIKALAAQPEDPALGLQHTYRAGHGGTAPGTLVPGVGGRDRRIPETWPCGISLVR